MYIYMASLGIVNLPVLRFRNVDLNLVMLKYRNLQSDLIVLKIWNVESVYFWKLKT